MHKFKGDVKSEHFEEDEPNNSGMVTMENNEDTLYMDEIAQLAKETEYTDASAYEPTYNNNQSNTDITTTTNTTTTTTTPSLLDTNTPSSSNGEQKKRRVVLDMAQKREIVLYHDANPTVSQQSIADYFSRKFQFKTRIARNTISTIITKRNLYFQDNEQPHSQFQSQSQAHYNAHNQEFNTEAFQDYESNQAADYHDADYNLTIEEIIELARGSDYNDAPVSSNEQAANEENEDNEDDERENNGEEEEEEEEERERSATGAGYDHENTSIKIEPRSYCKGEALLGLESIQGFLMQSDLLDENDLEYISKLRAKLDLIS